MKSYKSVYNQSKKEVLAEKAAIYEQQKVEVINCLKENYAIYGKISDMSLTDQKIMLEKVLQYWSPKSGINKAGKELVSKNKICLNEKSTGKDISKYIELETKRNIKAIVEAFKTNKGSYIVETFKRNVESQVGKALKVDAVRNIIWDVISESIKNQ